jgi:myo-inositol-1(or 4)-monophosphatase
MGKLDISYGDLLAICMEAAKAAGHHARVNESRRRQILQAGQHDVKLALDVECQQKAENVIRAHWREHAILGEESKSSAVQGDRPLWIIDPIDGTVNFMHGLPYWCSSVAVQIAGRTVAGAVYMPVLGELFTAAREKPALLNGKTIRVSSTPRLEEALVFAGLSKHLGKDAATLAVFEAISFRARKTRLMGAAAVDICNVACGRGDGYFESSIHLWDVAAAGLVLECAGGKVEVLEQFDPVRMRYLGTNGLVHEELKGIVKEALAAAANG